MARSRTQDFLVQTLGARRTQLQSQIDALQSGPTIEELQADLAEVEAQLKSIDASIPSLAEDAIAVQIDA